MSVPDAKTRNKISLNPSRVLATSIPNRLLPRIFLSNLLFVASLLVTKEWLLDLDVGVFWVTMRVLACGGVGVLVWEGMTGQFSSKWRSIEWPVLGLASLLVFIQQGCLFTALYRLSAMKTILFVQFSSLWVDALISTAATRKSLAIVAALVFAIVSDTQLSSDKLVSAFPGYFALVVHGVASVALDHTNSVLNPSLGPTLTVAASALIASIFALPLYLIRSVFLGFPPAPVLPLLSLACLPFVAYSILILSPISARALKNVSPIPKHFILSFPFSFVSSAIFGPLAFNQSPVWSDFVVGCLLYVGMHPQNSETQAITPKTPTSRLLRSYLKTIISNPESRRIFYFLMLNMCYMLVQMLYGVWTNSLGLISDAIHMAFDCMAIAVGLFASVMATWEPNERFTYGYGRIETLSGFANGIFLILISIFIVFEAIQRIIDPPEMDTSQLLLVSSLGLAVNLFGMFAMGGHHHHGGHSHSHGHSHEHKEHSRSPLSPSISHSHSHTSGHSHSHASNHSHSHAPGLSHSHASSHSHSHTSDHSHSHASIHPHTHSHSSGHSHTHVAECDDVHVHSHSYVHSDNHSSSDHEHLEKKMKRDFTGPPLQINPPDENCLGDDAATPLTPSYSFGHDDHFKTHHESGRTPNLHDHSHAPHSHEGHSHNMRGVFLHVMADTLGSVGVILSTLLIQFYGWTGFDPIASLFIAILIAASVIPLVIDTGKVLCLDNDERAARIQEALAELSSIEGLGSYSNPRFWPKDATSVIGSIHVQLAPSPSSSDPNGPHSAQKVTFSRLDRVVERVDSLLRQKISGLEELTIQVEDDRMRVF
ncbi:cation efflux protein [Dendrothele bispora CBS 962.96]|uniref:Cation efflux protein n=1 Tax=Dendrothele bispora (strain CBS 962.96) TaxID=1314807 RepID=A0A4S8LHW0_DENBC|nr:cation efflux protein [Dendrothele bispora CBS 962.96]